MTTVQASLLTFGPLGIDDGEVIRVTCGPDKQPPLAIVRPLDTPDDTDAEVRVITLYRTRRPATPGTDTVWAYRMLLPGEVAP